MKRGKWAKGEIAYLIELARDPHISVAQASKSLERNRVSISNRLKRMDVTAKWNTCRYRFNLNFFKKHSASLWYFLGFFYADGGITPQQFGFWLKYSEKPFLDGLLRLFSDAESKVYGDRCVWSTSHGELRHILMAFGLHTRKSLTISFPNMPKQYLPDFIRGYFDGDGCVSIREKDNWMTVEIFSGSMKFLASISKILGLHKIKTRLVKERSSYNVWRLKIMGGSIQDFKKFIYYSDKVFCLERKRVIMDSHISYRHFFGISGMAAKLGVTVDKLYSIRKKYKLPCSYKTRGGRRFYSSKDIGACKQLFDWGWV